MFNFKEFRGLLLLAVFILILSFISAFRFIKIKNLSRIPLSENEIIISSSLDSFAMKKQNQNRTKYTYDNESVRNQIEIEFTYFNPNNVVREDLLKMGLNENAVNNLMKYREKGGKFYKKDDLKKIYGISESTYKALENYIIIENEKSDISYQKPINEQKYQNNADSNSKIDKVFKKNKILIDINFADENELIKLNGVGEVLSKRILKYRDLLGGFVRVEQLTEVYGLSSETYEKIKDQIIIDTKMMKKIKINIIDQDGLSEFPYINKKQAQILINFRNQHGNFKNINDIYNIKSIDKEFIEKIEPYIDFTE